MSKPITSWMGIIAGICSAWAYLFYHARQMNNVPMSDMWMPGAALTLWPLAGFVWIYGMWAVMMAAMMLPTALPAIGAFSRYAGRQTGAARYHGNWFTGGYLAVWCGFSIILTGLQWLLHGLAWLSPMMENRQPLLAAGILIAAGLYQFTALKNACLQHCRSPFGFLLNEWRPGQTGAFHMGVKHGLNCLGCCWVQMLIMFATGVMNLWAMVLITLLVITEKWLPGNTKTIRYCIGVLLQLWGLYYLIAP